MKKIKRKVFFVFEGFEEFENGGSNCTTNVPKLLKGNFDKLLNLFVNKMLIKGVNHQNGFVDISSTVLKDTVGNYKPYVQYLINKGYLERSYFVFKTRGKSCPEYFLKNYRKNKPFGYRFTEYFKQEVKIKRIIFVPNTSVEPSKIKSKSQNKRNNNMLFFNPITIKRLKKDFNACQIINDKILKTNFQNSKYIDIGKWFYNQAELFKWKRGDKTFLVSTGRLYTNFTRLSSHVRSGNIMLNNEEILCKDISNSFPLMLAIYCIKENPQLINDNDFIEYCNWVTTGTFYKNLTESLNHSRNADEKHRINSKQSKGKHHSTITEENLFSKKALIKDVVKILFQIYLNGKIDNTPHIEGYGNSLIADFMKMKFSAIHEQITRLKDSNCCIFDKLVREESQFIFQVIENLYKKYDYINLLTVHDSIYTTKSDFQILDNEWNHQFKKLIEILPTDEQYETNVDIEDDFDNWIDENGGNIIELDELDNYGLINNIGNISDRRFNNDSWNNEWI